MINLVEYTFLFLFKKGIISTRVSILATLIKARSGKIHLAGRVKRPYVLAPPQVHIINQDTSVY